MSRIFRKLITFFKLSLRIKTLFLLTLLFSIYSYVLFKFFNKYALFGKRQSEFQENNFESPIVPEIRFVIWKVNQLVPFENLCRHQAYQAKLLCNFYAIPYLIFVGFKKNENGMIDGHAWTMVGKVMVTGFCQPNEYLVQSIYTKK